MTFQPRVSILIPCYNAERWIAQCIESALNQTYANKEVIVVDDGSTDGSLDIIKSFGEQIRWETGPNRGGNVARNRLLELSSGEWLQYLDADDYLLPKKIEHQMKYILQCSQVDVIYSPSILEYWDNDIPRQETLLVPHPHDVWVLLARWYLPQTGSPLWRKQAITDVGGWKVNQPCCQEHELYLRLLMEHKKFKYLEKAESIYRQWSELTICKRNQLETRKQKLYIQDRIENFLKSHGKMTPQRQDAINQARFECARMIWLYDRFWAKQIINTIYQTCPNFIPTGSAAPPLYLWVYRLLGFSLTEQFASMKRSLQIFLSPLKSI